MSWSQQGSSKMWHQVQKVALAFCQRGIKRERSPTTRHNRCWSPGSGVFQIYRHCLRFSQKKQKNKTKLWFEFWQIWTKKTPREQSDERLDENCSFVSMKRTRQGIEIRAETNTAPDCTLPLQLYLPALGWYNGLQPASVEQLLHFTTQQPHVMWRR